MIWTHNLPICSLTFYLLSFHRLTYSILVMPHNMLIRDSELAWWILTLVTDWVSDSQSQRFLAAKCIICPHLMAVFTMIAEWLIILKETAIFFFHPTVLPLTTGGVTKGHEKDALFKNLLLKRKWLNYDLNINTAWINW